MTAESIDEALSRIPLRQAARVAREPSFAERQFRVISVDDHYLEPPDTFEGRLARTDAERAPRVVETEDGFHAWEIEGRRDTLTAGNAVVTWSVDQWHNGPVRFDDLRRAAWDVDARVVDMDHAGVIAALNFPSSMFGFCGQRFLRMTDPKFGMACAKAYNDWIAEAWVGRHPDRFIACSLPLLADPCAAADEVRRNAQRGFTAVSFSENPERLGLPSIYTREWDPFFAACGETSTVINLHVGSSSQTFVPSRDSALEVVSCLFPVNGLTAAADWLYSGVLRRFPALRIALSEGGIGWVPMLIDRLQFIRSRFHRDGVGDAWVGYDADPVTILRRSFYFCTLWDPSALQHLHGIGADHVMAEVDYPHGDSTWPDTQTLLARLLADLDEADVRRITYQNAADLYRHPVPDITAAPSASAHRGGRHAVRG